MVLRRPVFDIRGYPVFEDGEKITADKLPLLARTGASEIVIDDPRVDDVPVGTLFPAYLEAKAVQALHVLNAGAGMGDGFSPAHLVGVRAAVNAMVQCLFPEAIGEPDLSGATVLEGYDYIHPVKVTAASLMIGRMVGMEEHDLVKLGLASMLENVGYHQLPPGILEKPGPLTEEERAYLEQHPVYSVEMLKNSSLDPEVLEAILHHHEQWSGRGYPGKLKGEQINRFARVIALGDAFHALVSKRPHRGPMKRHEALEFASAFSGDLFDPEFSALFARRLPIYPAGIGVRLSGGEIGIVSNPNLGHIARPVVRVCVENGRPVKEPYDLDLSEVQHMTKLIVEVVL